jgi:hypothetical protein
MLYSFGFLHMQCALTLLLQGWFNTSPNGECDSFPPAVTERQHEEILCSKMQNKRAMLLNKSSTQQSTGARQFLLHILSSQDRCQWFMLIDLFSQLNLANRQHYYRALAAKYRPALSLCMNNFNYLLSPCRSWFLGCRRNDRGLSNF